MVTDLPRIVVAAPASGHGKTTVATGLMAALRRTGLEVSGHKVGPDYIDPGYHALATGRPGRNLDPHLVGEERIVPLLLHGAGAGGGAGGCGIGAGRPADVAVIEGVMGLYDGHIGGDGFASTAHVAALTGAPVVLVVDISHASRSIAAVVLGMASYDPAVHIAGVVLNKAGSVRHSDEVRRALAPLGIPVLGVLQRDDDVTAPSRHLGLVPAAERPEAARSLDHLAGKVAASIDLEAVMRIAREAPPLAGGAWSARVALDGVDVGCGGAGRGGAGRGTTVDDRAHEADDEGRPLIAVAGGRAFTFRYAETVELLEAAGCSVVPFDPLADEALPGTAAGIYLGGGFPEVHAADLAANEPMLRALRAATAAGTPTVAECAGLLYLCRSLDGTPMVGAVDADAAMAPRLTLAYRRSTAVADSVLATAGTEVTGHEFHRTAVNPPAGAGSHAGAPSTSGPGAAPAWTSSAGPEGFVHGSVHASYLHTHWAGHPALAARFAAQARQFARVADRGMGTAAELV